MQKLRNKLVEIEVKDKGAELASFRLLEENEEFMWDANPKYWGKTSPVLFPFVGRLKENKFSYEGKEYEVPTQHGFARDNEFELVEKGEDFLKYRFSSNEKTLEMYPFEFDFYITYKLVGKKLTLEYRVVNKKEEEMYFSLGAHPAFATPTNEEVNLNDYYLEFEEKESASTFGLEGALIAKEKKAYLKETNIIELDRDTFINDAIMFEGLNSKVVTLKCKKNSRELKFGYEGFPIIAFWNVPGAEYVCIEPWYGIADFANHNGELKDKSGILKLEGKEEFTAILNIEVTA